MVPKKFTEPVAMGMTCFLALAECKGLYGLAFLKASGTNLSVVEGFTDGAFAVSFTLSRTRLISNDDTAARKVALNAQVLIEDDLQNTYPLTEQGNGVCSSVNMVTLNPPYRYRIHIYSSDEEEYLSDLVAFKPSPAIDAVNRNFQNNGVQVYLITHDPNKAARFYRWFCSQTWEFHAYYCSNYQYISGNNTEVPGTDQIYTCWHSDRSADSFLGSSAKLSNEVIYEMPLAYMAQHDQRLSLWYRIAVKQYPLDIKGYNYWLTMKNNTEFAGTIFEPQPGQTAGNIHRITNPAGNVVGCVNAGNPVESRVFISNRLMPADWNLIPNCSEDTIADNPGSLKFYFGDLGYISIIELLSLTSDPAAYLASGRACADYTLSGINVKPSFWP